MENNENGTIEQLYQRIPPEALRALEEGALGAAAHVAGRVRQAIKSESTKPKTRDERAKLNSRIKAAEAEALLRWATDEGVLRDGAEFRRKWAGQGKISGQEQRVYIEDDIVHKANECVFHGTWSEYFERLALHNWLFPEVAYAFEGFTLLSAHWRLKPLGQAIPGQLFAVITHPKVRSVRGATREEVTRDLAGPTGVFRWLRGEDYYNAEYGIVVQDLHDENAVVLEDGSIVIFDPVPAVLDALDYTKGGMLHGEEPPTCFERDFGNTAL